MEVLFFLSGFCRDFFRGGRASFFNVFLHFFAGVEPIIVRNNCDIKIVGIFIAGTEPHFLPYSDCSPVYLPDK